MRSTFALGVILASFLSASLVAPATAEDIARTITVTGTGEVSVAPDLATVVVAVQSEAETPAEALDGASAATAAILATLREEGLATEQIRSGTIRLNPRYSSAALSSGNRIIGYQAINSVEAEVRDLDRLGGLLAALVGEGANRIDGVTFGLQDPQAAQDEARRRAVAEGLRLAELYASAAGVRRGDLLSMAEINSGGYRPMRAAPMMLEMAASTPQHDVPTAPGEIELQASVNMVFDLTYD